MARAGYPPTAQFNYTVSASGTTSNLSSAVLQFRARGVTHVFSTDNGYASFLSSANSQHYYPRSAITTFDTPQLLQHNAPKKELAGAKLWAADAGHRIAHTTVHVHGGVGIDMDGEAHRYFTVGKLGEFLLGGTTDQARKIGALLAAEPV